MAKQGSKYDNFSYYDHIYEGGAETEGMRSFYRDVAEDLARKLNPHTVLDVGCATGMVVSGFRDIGVEAYGVDISEYAISKVRETEKEYVNAQDALDALPPHFPQHFDLVTCIEVAEHLSEEAADAFIGRLCELGDYVIFSSTPYDLEDPTHINVQQAEYWCKRFAKHGYFRSMEQEFGKPTQWTMCFMAKNPSPLSIVEDYERHIRISALQSKKQTFHAIAYVDRGDGFEVANYERFPYIGDEAFEHAFDLTGVKTLRIVPEQSFGWLVKSAVLVGRSDTILPSLTNGLYGNGMISFPTLDPFIDFDVSGLSFTQSVLKAQFCPLVPGDMVSFLQGLKKDLDALQAEIGLLHSKHTAEASALRTELEGRSGEIRTLTAQLAELQSEYDSETNRLQSEIDSLVSENASFAKETVSIRSAKKAVDAELENIRAAKDALEQELARTNAANHATVTHLNNQLQLTQNAFNEVNARYNEILNAFWWKITKPARSLGIAVKNLLAKNDKLFLFVRTVKHALTLGPAEAIRRRDALIAERAAQQNAAQASIPHAAAQPAPAKPAALKVMGIEIPGITQKLLDAQSKTKFPKDIKFSILVPLYNTPEQFLREMIHSVQYQTYGNWELCLADGSDAKHKNVGKICQEYAKKDSRIRYKALEKNMGISGNTNACIEMATGDYLALFDHDDLLHPCALYEDMKAICEKDADFIYTDEITFHDTPADGFSPHFKPDFAPDSLRGVNYICHFTVFNRDLLEKAGGGFRSEFDGSQDYDMILRLTEKAQSIVHIPKLLYYWRAHKNSVAGDISAKPYVMDSAKKALLEHLHRIGLDGEVENSAALSFYHIKYKIEGSPLISILIPSKDHIDDLDRCLNSILTKSTYQNYEIIVIENNSTEAETFAYYKSLPAKDSRIRVVTWKDKFNYSAINNFGFKYANGDYILLLNNDIEIITPEWLEEMLMFCQRPDVGAVGAKLLYPDNTVQHGGVCIGIGGVAGHYHKYFDAKDYGYMGRLIYAQNMSAVTAACMMVSRTVFEELNGLDESFEVAFNDVDFCLRIRKANHLIVFTPFAELYHHESKSRGLEDTVEKQIRFAGEINRFHERWDDFLAAGDPYYNPNFTLQHENYEVLPDAYYYK